MTNLEKNLIISKWQINQELSDIDYLNLSLYPNKENDLRIQAIKAEKMVQDKLRKEQ